MHVEGLDAGESDDDDAAHAPMVTRAARGRKDTYRTISATAYRAREVQPRCHASEASDPAIVQKSFELCQ